MTESLAEAGEGMGSDIIGVPHTNLPDSTCNKGHCTYFIHDKKKEVKTVGKTPTPFSMACHDYGVQECVNIQCLPMTMATKTFGVKQNN